MGKARRRARGEAGDARDEARDAGGHLRLGRIASRVLERPGGRGEVVDLWRGAGPSGGLEITRRVRHRMLDRLYWGGLIDGQMHEDGNALRDLWEAAGVRLAGRRGRVLGLGLGGAGDVDDADAFRRYQKVMCRLDRYRRAEVQRVCIWDEAPRSVVTLCCGLIELGRHRALLDWTA